MYRPPANRVDDLSAAVAMIRGHGFGHLVVAGPDGLDAVPVPVLVDAPSPPPPSAPTAPVCASGPTSPGPTRSGAPRRAPGC
jgi:hypothetical protein